jgi:prefoldin subunit 5
MIFCSCILINIQASWFLICLKFVNKEWDVVMKSYLEKGLPPLTNEDIQTMGTDYFNKSVQTNSKESKTTLSIVKLMMEYKDPGNVLIKWLQLFTYYRGLHKNSPLKQVIKNKVETDFGDPAADVIRTITYERGILQTYLFFIGSEYLKLFPEESKGPFGFKFGGHTNQQAAKNLVEASSKYLGRQSWMKLYLIYLSLPNDKGGIASSIRNLFEVHFNEPMEDTVKALELNKVTEKDVETTTEMPDSLKLPQEAEEQLLRLQAEQLFRKRDINLNVIEEIGIFWVNRSPYLRIVATGGATVCVPVAAGLFLTANVYALIGLGIAIGGGLFVLDLIGHTGLKIESVPDSILEVLKGNHIALSLSAKEVTRAANEMSSKLEFMSDVTDKQLQQLQELGKKNIDLGKQVELLQQVSEAFIKTQGDQKNLTEFLSNLTSGTSENAAKVLLVRSQLEEENVRLKGTVDDLKQQLDVLKQHDQALLLHMKHLETVMSEFKGSKKELEEITQIYKKVLSSVGVQQVPSTSKSKYLEAAEELYGSNSYPHKQAVKA